MWGKACRVSCRLGQAKEDPRETAKVSIKFSSDTAAARDAAKVALYQTVASPDAPPVRRGQGHPRQIAHLPRPIQPSVGHRSFLRDRKDFYIVTYFSIRDHFGHADQIGRGNDSNSRDFGCPAWQTGKNYVFAYLRRNASRFRLPCISCLQRCFGINGTTFLVLLFESAEYLVTRIAKRFEFEKRVER